MHVFEDMYEMEFWYPHFAFAQCDLYILPCTNLLNWIDDNNLMHNVEDPRDWIMLTLG